MLKTFQLTLKIGCSVLANFHPKLKNICFFLCSYQAVNVICEPKFCGLHVAQSVSIRNSGEEHVPGAEMTNNNERRLPSLKDNQQVSFKVESNIN